MFRRLLFAAFFLEVGLLLIVLPWSPFWERNYFAQTWPSLREFISNNFVRGGISGLGFVNLIAGFAELVPLFAAHDRRDEPSDGHTMPRVEQYRCRADGQAEP